jgi:uncharacterized membrane protein/heat shock protein HslJ
MANRRQRVAGRYPYVWIVAAALGGCESPDDTAVAAGEAAAETGTPVPSTGQDAVAAAESVPGGVWHLVTLQLPQQPEVAIDAAQAYTIEFAAGRVSGQAHCNRYTGGYQEPAPARLALTPFAATLAACLPPSHADAFMRLIGTVTRYQLRGEQLLLTSDDGGVLIFAREPSPAVAAAPEVGRTFVFVCDGELAFTVRTGPGEVAVWVPAQLGGRYAVLAATPAASGARYQEGDLVFWNKGEVATFELAGQTFADCRSNPQRVPWADAARRGALFRALGNEPSWNLEIHRDRLVLVTDFGEQRAEWPYADPVVAGARTTYRSVAGELVVVIDRQACVDTMSGEGFEASTLVTVNGTTFRGCGRFL